MNSRKASPLSILWQIKNLATEVPNDTLGPYESALKMMPASLGIKGVKHLSKLDAEAKREVLDAM